MAVKKVSSSRKSKKRAESAAKPGAQATLADVGLTKEVVVSLLEACEASFLARSLRDKAIERLVVVASQIITPIANLVTVHGGILNESFGLFFMKTRNDLKSKLGQPVKAPARAGTVPSPARFRDARSRPMSAESKEIRDKRPLTQNLGDKLIAAGVKVEEQKGENSLPPSQSGQ